jgi:hypothetical protein
VGLGEDVGVVCDGGMIHFGAAAFFFEALVDFAPRWQLHRPVEPTRIAGQVISLFRLALPAQPVDATPSTQLIGQHFL